MKPTFSNPGLFEDARMSIEDSMRLSVKSLVDHGSGYRHWAIAYSGGKDSSATVSFVINAIESRTVPRPSSLTVLYADTRMELPPLHSSAMKVLAAVQARGFEARVVLPALDDRYFVYMFGRGIPPPKNRFRWCTSQIKIEPMLLELAGLRDRAGEKSLMLTGVRLGESAARDERPTPWLRCFIGESATFGTGSCSMPPPKDSPQRILPASMAWMRKQNRTHGRAVLAARWLRKMPPFGP